MQRTTTVRADKRERPTTGEPLSVVVVREELRDGDVVTDIHERVYEPHEANRIALEMATAVARARLGMVDDA